MFWQGACSVEALVSPSLTVHLSFKNWSTQGYVVASQYWHYSLNLSLTKYMYGNYTKYPGITISILLLYLHLSHGYAAL
jgi:hypothetical protein